MTASAAPVPVVVRPALPEEAAEVAWLAALTFPLACPPGTPVATMAAHVASRLTPRAFDSWARSTRHALLVASRTGTHEPPAADRAADPASLLGYALVCLGHPDGDAERRVLRAATGHDGPYAELSKIYVHPDAQGSGTAGALMRSAIDAAAALGDEASHPGAPLWLGTNGQNSRAQAFYRKHGFAVVGARSFDVGGVTHEDVVMLRS